MPHHQANIQFLLEFLVVNPSISACQNPQNTPVLNVDWKIETVKFKIKDKLSV